MSLLSLDQRKALVRHYLETVWNTQEEADEKRDTLTTAQNDSQEYKHSCPTALDSPACVSLATEQPSPHLAQVRKTLCTTFPDISLMITDLIAEGEKVVVRWIMRGTDLGGYDGHQPTRRPIHLTGITIMRLEGHIIVEEWNEFDVAGMLHQLGFVYTPQPPKITVRRPRYGSRPRW
jgi:predicted ester cyclase